MKKILLSVGMLVAVAAVVAGATIAFYNDTETSAGNIFVAGSIDLKVDHLAQTYNGVDCKTCDVTLISDTSNMVVAKNGSPLTPYLAQFLSWVHPAWTAQNDSTLSAAGARWIWEQDPVKQEDTTVDAQYTFRKEFTWMGPIVGSDLWFAVGSDNSVEVWLNGVKVGENNGEFGYRQESMLHIPGDNITSTILQGNNVLEFKVKNWALPNGNPSNNPAGLIYKFHIDGNCGDAYFQNHCRLWQEKDLGENDSFFSFDDIKPSDWGTNLISLHVESNDAYACLFPNNIVDGENTRIEPEETAGDETPDQPDGELSQFIKMFAWVDEGDGVYEEGETTVIPVNTPFDQIDTSVLSMNLPSGGTGYIGLAWCVGTQSLIENDVECSGNASGIDKAQTDSVSAALTAYAVQQRNNTRFSCTDEYNELFPSQTTNPGSITP